jgi:hypothetical protein
MLCLIYLKHKITLVVVCSDDIPKNKLKTTATESLRKALAKQEEQNEQENTAGMTWSMI